MKEDITRLLEALIDAVAKKSEWLRAVDLLNTLAQSTAPADLSDLIGPAVASCQEATQWEVALYLWHMAPSNAASHSLLLALSQAGFVALTGGGG